jgi:hypothetical protein
MKKSWMWMAMPLVAAAMIVAGNTAMAIKPFEAEFKKMYYKPDGDANQKKLAEAIDKITMDGNSCGICHPGKSKKERNEYGKALNKLVTKMDKDDAKKIAEALKSTEGEKNSAGKTFGEQLKAGLLPSTDGPGK